MTNVNEMFVTGKYDIECSFKKDKNATESKKVTLRFNLNNVCVKDLLTPALANKRIVWQNSVGRGKYDLWKDGQVVEVEYASPGSNVKSEQERIMEAQQLFMKAGMSKKQALELATKAVQNPEILSE